MNVNGIGVVGYLAMYGMREIEGHVADKNFADEISKAAERLETEDPDSGKAITKMRPMGGLAIKELHRQQVLRQYLEARKSGCDRVVLIKKSYE